MNKTAFAEYLWIDGDRPTQQIRSKARVVRVPENPRPSDFPDWSFDGSSTGQASGDDSDCLLQPVRVYPDPLRRGGNYLVLCEVNGADGRPHSSNERVRFRRLLDVVAEAEYPWLGFEQEYTLFRGDRPLGFPESGEPAPQGPYYCGAGSHVTHGRDFVESHADACVRAGVLFYGINAEVMPGQWEFQIGYRGIDGECPNALRAADDLWVARYLLHRCGEQFGIRVSLDPKPAKGDWNGAGLHTNFSTSGTRDPESGLEEIRRIIDALEMSHAEHIRHYGDRLGERLTGLHETSDIATFNSGVAHRGASIRIPQPVAQKGYGYLEDRRPGANADPYKIGSCLVGVVVRNWSQASAEDRAA
jgi:glutamine synthetase